MTLRRLGILIVALLLGASVRAQGADQAAVDAFRRGDVETARSLWLAALETATGGGGAPLPRAERGRILYDLGNVAFRRGDVLEAVGWYTASLRARPRDADAWRNLEHARTTAKIQPADRGDLASTVRRLLAALTLPESEWLALAAGAVWAGLLVGEALRGGRLWRRLSVAGLALVLASLAPWIYNRVEAARDPVLVIEAGDRGTEVRSEPRADAAVIASVTAGEELERIDELPEWIKVEVTGGATGWVRRSAVFPLDR